MSQSDRRSFVLRAGLGLVALSQGRLALGDPPAKTRSEGLIVREKEPENLEFPFGSLDSFTTPNELFYVRNHFAAPTIDVKKWKLKVEGAVEHPLELGLEDVLKMTTATQPATLECAGNGRVFLTPKATGVNWEMGAVSTAKWGGVPLNAVLDKAGVKKGAVEVILEGADSGEVKADPKSPGVIHFARSLPLAKAMKKEVLLAHQMNDADLSAAHGYPIRAVVPGWYGMASVKWLSRIIVVEKPFAGYYQTMAYTYFDNVGNLPSMVPITELQVKSQIARPTFQEVVPAKSKYRVFGAAWSGESAVDKVEVSTDGGKTWAAAKLLDDAVQYCWRLWEYQWQTPDQAGRVRLMSRATDRNGRTQTMQREEGRGAYMISQVLPVEVVVR
jgi:DMSO/TMAO reductase YedYZ molybdopterin-dependent catalytic subunit